MQFWVEKTYVAGRPDRQQGEFALGSALWSPHAGSDGRDTYRLMRDVKPGDIVFHFIDKKEIVGISEVLKEYDETFLGPKQSDWEGKPIYCVRLKNYTKLARPVDISEFLGSAKYRSQLSQFASNHDSIFFTKHLKLRQGAYLTIAYRELLQIWDEIHFQKTGAHLPLMDVNLLTATPDKLSDHEYAESETEGGAVDEPVTLDQHYWTFSVGRNGEHWEEFYQSGIIAIGWEGTPDLRHFKNKEELRAKLLELFSTDTDKKNDAHACWQFAREMQKGDIIFAKQGQTRLLGYGVVEGDYVFDPTRKYYKHVRNVKWLAKGKWELPEDNKMALKTLTDVTQYAEFVKLIANKVGLQMPAEAEFPESASNAIKESNNELPMTAQVVVEYYDKSKAMDGLFLAESQFDEMLEALKEKKNVVLQGAPGVGKTFVAKRLAYTLIESNDQRQVEVIQFHQSYSYEDFIQGFRPTPNGHFDLKFGIFYEFCRRAQRDEAAKKPYVFIIDEINRGNLSKIFGELMMLIEPDKRGKEHAIPLAYSQNAGERFYIPENLHLIGMMNTADRSLAMVDYALRRRFRFITLRPEFSSDAFGKFLGDTDAALALTKKIVSRMNTLNDVIASDTRNLGPGYQIGHSYFCPRNGIKPSEDWYRRVIESEIVPLIQEYWFDNEQKVKEQCSALLD
jgi:5-methylcytosine-specific restriction protein B